MAIIAGYSSASARFLDKFSVINLSYNYPPSPLKESVPPQVPKISTLSGAFWDHVSVDKGREIEIWFPVKVQFVVNQLVCSGGIQRVIGDAKLGDILRRSVP
jgi:hypothetical protein